MDNPIISLYINSKEISSEQFNDIVRFIDNFARFYGNTSIEIMSHHLPLRINGRVSLLTSRARDYFAKWNKDGTVRKIALIKEETKYK